MIDGRVLTTDPNTAQAAAGFNDTPIPWGFNWEENSGFDPKFGAWTKVELAERRSDVFGLVADQAAALYPLADYADALKVGPVMARERYRAAVYEWARRRTLVSRSPIYMYFFNQPEPGPAQTRYESFHSSEIPYVFGNLDAPRPFMAQDHAVSERMQVRWVAFVEGGAPDGAGLTPWPAFSASQPTIMLLGDKEGPEAVLPPEKLQLSAGVDGPARCPQALIGKDRRCQASYTIATILGGGIGKEVFPEGICLISVRHALAPLAWRHRPTSISSAITLQCSSACWSMDPRRRTWARLVRHRRWARRWKLGWGGHPVMAPH